MDIAQAAKIHRDQSTCNTSATTYQSSTRKLHCACREAKALTQRVKQPRYPVPHCPAPSPAATGRNGMHGTKHSRNFHDSIYVFYKNSSTQFFLYIFLFLIFFY